MLVEDGDGLRDPDLSVELLDLPPLVASIDMSSKWPGGLRATVNAFRHVAQGGAESAEIAVAGPLHGLLSLLRRVRQPVRVTARVAGTVWTGYVHRVEVETGAMRLAASVDGMRTAVALEHPVIHFGHGGEISGGWCRTLSRRRVLAAGSITWGARSGQAQADDADYVASLTEDYLEPARAITQSGDGAVGATLFCRGWATALATTLAPRFAEPSLIEAPPKTYENHAYTYFSLSSSTRRGCAVAAGCG